MSEGVALRVPYHVVLSVMRLGIGWGTLEETLVSPLVADVPDAWVTEDGDGYTWVGCEEFWHDRCPTCASSEPCIQDITVRKNGTVLVIHDAELRGLA